MLKKRKKLLRKVANFNERTYEMKKVHLLNFKKYLFPPSVNSFAVKTFPFK